MYCILLGAILRVKLFFTSFWLYKKTFLRGVFGLKVSKSNGLCIAGKVIPDLVINFSSIRRLTAQFILNLRIVLLRRSGYLTPLQYTSRKLTIRFICIWMNLILEKSISNQSLRFSHNFSVKQDQNYKNIWIFRENINA